MELSEFDIDKKFLPFQCVQLIRREWGRSDKHSRAGYLAASLRTKAIRGRSGRIARGKPRKKLGKSILFICVRLYSLFRTFQKVLDKNKSGVIEFDEFARLMEERAALRDDDQQRVFREAFKVFDQDESGKITAEELRCVDP